MTDRAADAQPAAPDALEGFRRVDAAMLERDCGVRPTRGDAAMKHVPRPLFKGWREGVQWRQINGTPYVRTDMIEPLRERVRAARSTTPGMGIERAMAACRRRELADEKADMERQRIRQIQADADRKPRRRSRTGDVYVPIKDRS